MNCHECNEKLSPFMDGELDEALAEAVRLHLADCVDCAKVCEDISAILFTCSAEEEEDFVSPNFEAIGRRIFNTIESEIAPPKPVPAEGPRRRFWSLTFPQLASAVLGVAIISSLLTIVGIRNYVQPVADDFTTRNVATQTTFEKVLAKVGLVETPQQARERRLKEQLAAISYWDNRVQARRVQWDARTREAFDRNLKVINETLDQYDVILQKDPDDELSVEMMDSVINDKMNLLRDFSDL